MVCVLLMGFIAVTACLLLTLIEYATSGNETQ
jgi:hypothetical protein